MPKVLKTRKMKMKKRIRHRKSRVIKTKSRKNRYRRKTKYKVGGATLHSEFFDNIRNFITANGDDVIKAETEYRRLHTWFSDKVGSPCFNPDKMTGTFNKKNRLHDILEKIKADTNNKRDVKTPYDYEFLSKSLDKLQNTEQAIRQVKDQAARGRFLEGQEKERRQQQPQVHSGFATFQQQQDQKYFKVSIDDTKIIRVDGLQLFKTFDDGSEIKVTKIPKDPKDPNLYTHLEISNEDYSSVMGDESSDSAVTATDVYGNTASHTMYNYKLDKRDPANPVYYVRGNVGLIDNLLRSHYSSGAYEYRMTKGECTDSSTTTLEIATDLKPEVDKTTKDTIQKLWTDANCLLKNHPEIFTRVNPRIVSSSGNYSLGSLVIAPEMDLRYNKGIFSGFGKNIMVYNKRFFQDTDTGSGRT